MTYCYSNSSGSNSAVNFLRSLSPGTTVTVQYDSGGVNGVIRGIYQGIDQNGNAQFSGAVFVATNTPLPGITHITLNQIHSVSL